MMHSGENKGKKMANMSSHNATCEVSYVHFLLCSHPRLPTCCTFTVLSSSELQVSAQEPTGSCRTSNMNGVHYLNKLL